MSVRINFEENLFLKMEYFRGFLLLFILVEYITCYVINDHFYSCENLTVH